MSNVALFQPKSQLDANANLVDFIEFAKKLDPLGVVQSFENNSWSAGKAIFIRESHRSYSINFTRLIEVDGKPSKEAHPRSGAPLMAEPFLSFAKAMICYIFALEPSTAIKFKATTLRYLHFALLNKTGCLCPSGVNPEVLNFTCQLLIAKYRNSYQYGIHLQHLYATMTDLRLVSIPIVWRSFIHLPDSNTRRSGKEFDALRNKRLPNPLALDGLAYIFNNPKDKADIAVTSVCALLLCDPDRIIEVLTASVNCIATDEEWINGFPEPGLTLRWFPAKKGNPMRKPVIPSMAGIARRAIDNLRKLGEPARKLARWYEINPTKIYLPPHLESLRSKRFLSREDLNAILFDGKRLTKYTKDWINSNIPQYKVTSDNKTRSSEPYIPFEVVQKAILALLPKGFPVLNPETGVKFSDALCICRVSELTHAPYLCVLQPMTYSMMFGRLNSYGKHLTIFEKHGMTDEIGGPLFIKSHMFRHYLSSVGIAGGLFIYVLNSATRKKILRSKPDCTEHLLLTLSAEPGTFL